MSTTKRKPDDLYRAIAHYHEQASHATPRQIAEAFRAAYGGRPERTRDHTRDGKPREHKVHPIIAGRAT